MTVSDFYLGFLLIIREWLTLGRLVFSVVLNVI